MFYCSVLIACLLSLPRGEADPRTSTRKYKPVIQVTEEIDINDITFTTSAPELERSSSHKTSSYYNGIKSDGIGKGGRSRLGDTSPSIFPHVNHKDSYGAALPPEKIYSTGQPLVAPAVKFKPYKVFKVQEGFRPVVHKTKILEKSKLLSTTFDPPTTYGGPEPSKHYSTKVVPLVGLSAKAPTRATTFQSPNDKNFIPSPTFSPTILAQINYENGQSFPERPVAEPLITQKVVDWGKPTKKLYHNTKTKKIPDNHQLGGVGGDFTTTSENFEQNLGSSTLHKESPQKSESFLSEISTLHKGGSNGNNLDGVADSLDLKTGERVEFQMYGMDGPQSYKFGFDTGKGLNRHFRFEERDNTGKVKGHYGYLDEDGKMRIMKYEADPVTGFHAGPVEISQDDN